MIWKAVGADIIQFGELRSTWETPCVDTNLGIVGDLRLVWRPQDFGVLNGHSLPGRLKTTDEHKTCTVMRANRPQNKSPHLGCALFLHVSTPAKPFILPYALMAPPPALLFIANHGKAPLS